MGLRLPSSSTPWTAPGDRTASSVEDRGYRMIVLLTVLSALAVVLLFGALVFYLIRIISALESIGGETPRGYSSRSSYLSKIAFGVRAIEQQTGHLGPEVTRLNESLEGAAAGLRSIDDHLGRTVEAAGRQDGG